MDHELRQVLEAMQRDNSAAHSETRRHFDIVAEELRQELRVVTEGVGSLSEKIAHMGSADARYTPGDGVLAMLTPP